MINSLFLNSFFRGLILILAQVFVFNNIYFLGYITPFVYLFFIVSYPTNRQDITFLILSFLVGLGVDFFENTGGANAFSITLIAFLRLFFLRIISGGKDSFSESDFSIEKISLWKRFLYIFVVCWMHVFMLYYISYFSFDFHILIEVISRSTPSALLSSFIILSMSILNKKEKIES